jgi:hypothetical protein
MSDKNKTPGVVTAAKGAYTKNYAGNISNNHKPLPPYGREAAWLLSWGVKPKNDIFIFVGLHAWKLAKHFQDTQLAMLLPPNTDPASYLWPVQDCPVLVFINGDASLNDIEKLSYRLLLDGAEIVRTYQNDSESIYYTKD